MNKEMKKILLAALCCVCFPLWSPAQYRTGYAELSDSEMAATLRSHVGYLSAPKMLGRKAGSDGEKEAGRYVASLLESYGVEMLYGRGGDVFGISQEGKDTLKSRNVAGVVLGYDKALRDRYIVVGARLDNLGTNTLTVDGVPREQIYYGANGNASGLAVLMELAKLVCSNSVLFRRSVIFIGFGASAQSYAGAWYFLNRSFPEPEKIDAMINLDMLGTGSAGFYAYTASNMDLNAVLAAQEKELQPVVPTVTTQEAYPSDHRAFYSAGIPSVFFTTGQYPEHDSPRDVPEIIDFQDMEKEVEYLFNFTRALANTTAAPRFKTMDNPSGSRQERSYSWHDCDEKPTFLGHSDPRWFLSKWVYQYLKYPQEAVEKGIQGRVNVEFAIDAKGNVTDVRVVKGADPLLDAEAVKVISASPKWKPAKMAGERVRSYMTLTVEFRLEKKNKNIIGIKK